MFGKEQPFLCLRPRRRRSQSQVTFQRLWAVSWAECRQHLHGHTLSPALRSSSRRLGESGHGRTTRRQSDFMGNNSILDQIDPPKAITASGSVMHSPSLMRAHHPVAA